MSKQPKVRNPFYMLLGVVGAVFAVTACAYGVLMLQLDKHAGMLPKSAGSLLIMLDAYGTMVLYVEIALLAVLTVLAIGTEDFWHRRAASKSQVPNPNSQIESS